jgi:CSLREA domain-containing protein
LNRQFLLAAVCLSLALSSLASTYTVNDLGDAPDAAPGNDVCATAGAVCTLRAAIMEANAHPGPDTIIFSVAGTILAATPYPSITERITIDATSAPGYSNAPVVIVDGMSSVAVGIDIAAGANQSVVNGLQISGFTTAGMTVEANQSGALACYLGPVLQGAPNGDGIQISGTQDFVGAVTGGLNVISANNRYGVLVSGGSAHSILKNHIGTDAAGVEPMANQVDGIHVQNASSFTIGSGNAVDVNLISGNGANGIALDTTTGIVIAGNLIGLDSTGTSDIGNGASGVRLTASNNCSVGNASARNVISANVVGVEVVSGTGIVIGNNYLGMDITGTTALGNVVGGVQVLVGAPGTQVGTPTLPNVSSGNGSGVIVDADNVSVRNNIIGLDPTGANIIGNLQFGIILSGGRNTPTIGGSAANEGNVVSGNGQDGILLDTTTGGTVAGNTVGLKRDRTDIRGNGEHGIHLSGCSGVTVGGATAGARNYVSGNSLNGIQTDVNGSNLTVQGNFVGTDGAGAVALGNAGNGIEIETTTGSLITGNLTSGNAGHGMELCQSSSGNTVTLNTIGRALNNSGPLPNAVNGLELTSTANNNTIGGSSAQNIIASNTGNGVDADSGKTDNNNFAANSIFGNSLLGIDLGNDGATPNDPGDGDSGDNGLQNFPTPTYAQTSVNGTQVGGTINSNANTMLAIHLYSSPSGNQGQTYLGSTNATTDGSGNASWTFNTATALTVGQVVTSTANGPHGTSEFSGSVTLVASPSVQFLGAPYTVNENAGSATITVSRIGDLSGTSTVNYATSDGTAVAPGDYTPSSGTLTFLPTVASQTFSVPIINDALPDPNETINLTLSSPANATIGGPTTTTLTIVDNDAGASADVSITKKVALTGINQLTFTLTVANAGPATATGVTTSDTLPGAYSLVSATTPGGSCSGTRTIVCTLPALASGASTTVTIVTSAAAYYLDLNTATVTASQIDPNPANNSATVPTDIPTLSEWALLALAAALAIVAWSRLGRSL